MRRRRAQRFILWAGLLTYGLPARAAPLLPADEGRAATHVISAYPEVLYATLAQRGWVSAPPGCQTPNLCERAAAHADVQLFVRRKGPVHGAQVLYVWSVAAPARTRSLPAFAACAAQADISWIDEEPLQSNDARADLTDDLLSGLALLRRDVVPGQGPGAWVELRHAVGEIDGYIDTAISPLWCAADVPGGDDASVSLPWMPPVAPLQASLIDTLIWRDNADDKLVALTFDACSTFYHGAYNGAVIEALERAQIPATLFIGGHWAETHPHELRYLAAQPQFELGNHTYSHPHMTQLSPARQREELLWTQYLIYALTGVMPRFYRPPYGETDEEMVFEAARLGLYTVQFDLPAGDADMHIDRQRLIRWVVQRASSGSIIIMHMNHPGSRTAEALPEIARALRARGFVFAKVSELLAHMQATPHRALVP